MSQIRLNSEQLAVITEVFHLFEHPSYRSPPSPTMEKPTGMVQAAQLCQFLRTLGFPISRPEALEYVHRYAKDAKLLNFDDVLRIISAWKSAPHPEFRSAAETIFKCCNPEDGTIAFQALRGLLLGDALGDQSNDLRLTEDELAYLTSEFDISEDSRLSIDDIYRLLGPPQPLV
ncbi:hypothetical protein GMRT_13854 [Giardia muris]|uniref:Uncharacterized protein n=1 Tax=Giardia muris TaxID=5742 RepID=A0A4Z1SQW9_GIAMU|nr:hypothetical protein GMRT_13854 [Giardia muris]|eukprot:TNJ27345.1 hypothetical protein GMRT_13854 [Giardia muris]